VGRVTPPISDLAKPERDRTVARFVSACLGVIACVLVIFLPGCSGRTSYITGGPSTGQLKTSLSRLEYENDQLKTQVARLKEESRSMEERLVQEQIHTGTLTAKLDDARNALRDDGQSVDDFPSQPRTLPAGRRTSKPRKPPTAQISSEDLDDDPPPLIIDDEKGRSRSNRPKPRSSRAGDDSVSMAVEDDNLNWVPVGNGSASKAAAKR